MKSILTLLILVYSLTLFSQDSFWSEDFANGIPSEWEIEEESNIGVTWTYCPDTTMYSVIPDNTCPHEFNDFFNGFQVHFKSDTPENGYATCVIEPFVREVIDNPFTVNLTTDAIDCSNRGTVFVTFNSHLGLNFAPGDPNVMFRVSTDKNNWTTFLPHPYLIRSASTVLDYKRWSENAKKIEFDISDIAAGEEEVFLQWRWIGEDEFHWSIDDVALRTETTRPALDISLSPTIPFQAIMMNYKTPLSQIDTAFFITDIGNIGSQSQSNLEVRALVVDESNLVLYSDTFVISQLDVNQRIEEVSFLPYFHQAGTGEFKIIYETSFANDDTRLDFVEFPFIITESEFAKHESPVDTVLSLFPTNTNDQDIIIADWAIANHFYLPNGENFFLDSVHFEIPGRSTRTTPQGLVVLNELDISFDVILFEWMNSPDFNFATVDEYSIVGRGEFIVTGSFENETISVKLNNLISNNSDNIPLKNDQHYFLAIDYNPFIFNQLFSIKASTLLCYDATIFAHQEQNRQRFASLLKIGPTDNTYDTFAFGGDVIPHLGFTITEENGVSTDQVLVADGLRISPNPVDQVARIQFNLDIKDNDVLELHDISGRLIKTIILSSNQDQLELSCSMLPNANYLLTYKSEKVISNSKLIVMH